MRAEGEGCLVPCSASLRTCVQVAHIHLWVCPCLGTAMTVTSLGPLMWKVQVNLVRWVHKYGICEQWFLFSTWGNNLNWGWQLKTTFGFFYLLMKSVSGFPFCLLGTEIGIIFSSSIRFSNICREPIPFFSYFSFLLFLGHTVQHVGEGNGTPLQYSCLENPMDGGAW